ncbi:DNA cytosine methyltransferase [Delftia lacustris]|uniref:DNA cytosine methyltransferase n=1 Tax=Delftia lacustris TaxID=558537 RepID=UPI00193C4837|nr:DNA cytosine methyltransferase [Delftia lacustris]QRI92407.1 DNA cytosine methyltransferase [Delftia lacustris]
MFDQMSLLDTSNATSSPGSPDGLSPCASHGSQAFQASGLEAPCQDNSVAAAIHGGRAGLSGARSGLAHTWLDLIAALQPQGICFENVPGISPWLAEITSRLGQLGYRVRRPERSSADVGAPHLRRRVWIVADRGGQGFPRPRRPEPPAPFCDPRATPPGDVFISSAGRTRPLDDGLPSRVGAVHAYGNAIDPWAAAEALRSLI